MRRGNSHLLHCGSQQDDAAAPGLPLGLTPQQEVHSLPAAPRGCRHWELWGRRARPEPHLQRRQMEREEPAPHLLRKVTRKQIWHSEKASPSATRKLSAKSQNRKKKKRKKEERVKNHDSKRNEQLESARKKSSAAPGLLPSADNRPVPSPQPVQLIVPKL